MMPPSRLWIVWMRLTGTTRPSPWVTTAISAQAAQPMKLASASSTTHRVGRASGWRRLSLGSPSSRRRRASS